MNDPIKDFVEQHREDFDDLEAPKFDLAGFKAKMAQKPVSEKPAVLMMNPAHWMAAAVALLVCAAGFWVFNSKEQAKSPEQQLVVQKRIKLQQTIEKPLVKAVLGNTAASRRVKQQKTPVINKQESKKSVTPAPLIDPILDEQLNDSTSSSTRLAAVLAIKRNDLISYELLDRLAITLQQDGNSNVRMAALSILEKYQQDAHVSNLLVKALHQQNDPMVQLALVNLLGKMDNVKIDERLYALVNDPSTIDAVKDEAYHILLKENKF